MAPLTLTAALPHQQSGGATDSILSLRPPARSLNDEAFSRNLKSPRMDGLGDFRHRSLSPSPSPSPSLLHASMRAQARPNLIRDISQMHFWAVLFASATLPLLLRRLLYAALGLGPFWVHVPTLENLSG